MTQETDANPPTAVFLASALELGSADKKELSIGDLVACFQTVGDDIVEIGRLTFEEQVAAERFFASLKKHMQTLASSVAVSTSLLPIELGIVAQAHILSTGHLQLTFQDGRQELVNLSEAKTATSRWR